MFPSVLGGLREPLLCQFGFTPHDDYLAAPIPPDLSAQDVERERARPSRANNHGQQKGPKRYKNVLHRADQ